MGRRKRSPWLRAALPCLLIVTGGIMPAHAQSVTSEMLRPVEGATTPPLDSGLRRTPSLRGITPNPGGLDPRPAPIDRAIAAPPASSAAASRINRLPTFRAPAASGAGTTGFDALNRKRALAKRYPGAPRPKTLPGAAQPRPAIFELPAPSPPTFSAQVPTVTNTDAPSLLARPSLPASARAPLSASLAGNYTGAPTRRRLRGEDDPFGAVGFYAGSFLVKPAIELGGGVNSNPSRLEKARGSAYYAISPELNVASNWSRHSLSADLRGTFTGYEISSGTPQPCDCGSGGVPTASPVPSNIDRPDFNARVNGRYDVTRDTRINGEGRARVGTDNPGSPDIQVGLSRYPLFLTTGMTLGIEQNFNRLQFVVNGFTDRTEFQNSRLTNGVSASNADRNFDQYGALTRISYDVLPNLRPFGEVQIDQRVRDQRTDRSGFARNSDGVTVRAGTTFELTRLLIGEASIGYVTRKYDDPRLANLSGFLARGSLAWAVTGLTTLKFTADTTADESAVSGVSGVLTRSYTLEVDHDFRRWLTGIGKFTAGTIDYQGNGRSDKFYTASANVLYKMNREMWLKGEIRHEWLDSNLPGSSSRATIVMLGLRLQR